MARGESLLERLNEVLEALGLRLAQDQRASTTQPTTSAPAANQGANDFPKGDWLSGLFANLFKDLDKRINSGTTPTDQSVGAKASRPRRDSSFDNVPVHEMSGQATQPRPKTPTLELESTARQREWEEDRARSPVAAGNYSKQLKNAAGLIESPESSMGREAKSKLGEVADTAQLATRAVAGDPTAMIGLVDKAAKKFEERMEAGSQAVSSFGKALTQQDGIGHAAGSMFEGAQQGLKAVGLEGTPADEVLKFGKAVAESVEKLRDMSRQVLDLNFRFAEVSGAMAGVQGRQQVRDIRLSQEKGNARADSTEDLAEAYSELNETLRPLEDAWSNFSNEILTRVVTGAATLIKLLGVIEVMSKMLEKIAGAIKPEEDPDKDKGRDFTRWLSEQGANYGRPPRIPPGG